MPNEGVFGDEWRACLRAHYSHVVRTDDKITLKSLVTVMEQVGFSEDDLKALYVQATMRADDVDADFVPDFEFLSQKPEPEPEMLPVLQPVAVVEVEPEAMEDPVEMLPDERSEVPRSPSDPVQLSLF